MVTFNFEYWLIERMPNKDSISDYCSQTFVILDKWFNQVGAEKGEDALKIVTATIDNNIKSNITYYEDLAKAAEMAGQIQLARKHRLLAKLYTGLLNGIKYA